MYNAFVAGIVDLMIIAAGMFGAVAGFAGCWWLNRQDRKRFRRQARYITHIEAQLDRLRSRPVERSTVIRLPERKAQ